MTAELPPDERNMPGPCVICGDRNYPLSCGGPTICPKCDCGIFNAATVEKQARVIAGLRAALAKCREETVAGVVAEVAAERRRQIEKEGWLPEHDDKHSGGELAEAAACYALGKDTITSLGGDKTHIWPWSGKWWKPTNRRRDLIKAAALIVAEIERIDRALASTGETR